MTDLRISVRNTSEDGGTVLTPFFFGFHDGSFDIYNLGEAASPGLEALAEDGNNVPLANELTAADADAQTVNVAGTRGPIGTGEFTSTTLHVNGLSNPFASFASMLLPSNDAFVGTANGVRLFDASGNFLGASTTVFSGASVRDAGTEVNTELDAAFINQTAPNTGITEGGVVSIHPGFNGSAGNPVGEGDQIILGGTNAFGDFIDPEAADFTLPGAQIATVHINTVVERDGTDGRDVIKGRRDDDIVNAGDDKDIILGRAGWDVLNGEGGNDKIWGGRGDDQIDGGEGDDWISGGRDNDIISGGEGHDDIRGGSGDDQINGGDDNDWISGGRGNDVIAGGQGNDYLNGNRGDDTFVFVEGDGHDVIRGFDRRGDDQVLLSVTGFEDFDDVLAAATQERYGVELDLGTGDSIFFKGTSLSSLGEDDFLFV